jgi:hypothetical protein
LISDVGGAYLFSAAHLHSTVPNTSNITRYSIDFRTVHLDDVMGRIGAPNIDSACTGTTIGDFLRARDFSHLPPEAMAPYQDSTEILYAQSATDEQMSHEVIQTAPESSLIFSDLESDRPMRFAPRGHV